jgi:hypothetical protein
MRKFLVYGAIIVAGLLIGGIIGADIFVRSLGPRTRNNVVRVLQDRFDADVELKDLQLSLVPQPTVTGQGLAIHHRTLTDPKPLIYVAVSARKPASGTLCLNEPA